MSKKTGRFFSNVQSKGKQEHQGVNRKGQETQKLTKPDEKYVNKALKKEDMLIEKYGSANNYYDLTHINCKVLKDMNIYVSALSTLDALLLGSRTIIQMVGKGQKNQIYRFIDNVGGLDELPF